MANIIDVIKKLENLRHLQAASPADIEIAESRLGLTFAIDYKEYVQTYGAILAKGVELTGVSVPARLNVVDVTLGERERENIPASYYVLESLNIESVLILQNSEGHVFEYYAGEANKIADSMVEYILSK